MKKILLCILLTISFYTQAQNYNCLQPGIKPFFTNGNGYLRGMRIDSVRASGSDTIFYPYHTPRGQFFGPFDSSGGSWLGGKVIKQADGTFLFDNLWGDTVVIKTQASLGDSWTFYEDTTKFSYMATVTSVDTMTILGVVDSVKKITISADSGGAVYPSDPVNNFQFILSKNNGFVAIFDLVTFPYHQPLYNYYDYSSGFPTENIDYYLDIVLGNFICNCDSPPGFPPDSINSIFHRIPFHNPTKMELYNYSVGEVLEFEDQNTEYGGDYMTTNIRLDTVLSKTVTPVSVTYILSERNVISTIAYPTYSPTYSGSYVTGITVTYDTSRLIDTTIMPEEWNAAYFYHYFPKPSYDSGKTCPDTLCIIDVNNIAYPSGQIILEEEDPSVGMAFLGNYTSTYAIGFGLSTISYTNYTGSSATENAEYIYVSNGDSICGGYADPLPLSVTQLNAVNNQIDIFPNPANDVLNINASAAISQVTITNLLGQAVYTHSEYSGNKMQVDISALPAGIYLVKINNTDVRKFVKE